MITANEDVMQIGTPFMTPSIEGVMKGVPTVF
jgi:hypothetical protein